MQKLWALQGFDFIAKNKIVINLSQIMFINKH